MQFLSDYWPLIKPDDTFALLAVIAAGVALSIFCERRYRWGAVLSGPVVAMVLAMILSNLRIVPLESPVYERTTGLLLPLAIPLLLIRANLVSVIRKTGPLFVAFHIASFGTVLGALAAGWLFASSLDRVSELAGVMTASYIGGGINFVAVATSYRVESSLTSPLLVADNFVMAGLFVVLSTIATSKFFLARYPHPLSKHADADHARARAARFWRPKRIALGDVARALAWASIVAAIANGLASWIASTAPPAGDEASPKDALALAHLVRRVFGNVLVLTPFISVAGATMFRRQLMRIRGAHEIGTYFLYIFLFIIGLPGDLVEVVRNVPAMFGFCLLIAAANLAVALVVGRFLKLNLEDLLLAVNASVGGPPTAAAMAVARGWSRAVLPALLVGLWGYVIGTAIGVAVTEVLRRLL